MNEPTVVEQSVKSWDFIGNIIGFLIGFAGYLVLPRYMRRHIAEGKIPPENEGKLKWIKFCFMGMMLYYLVVIVLSMLGKW